MASKIRTMGSECIFAHFNLLKSSATFLLVVLLVCIISTSNAQRSKSTCAINQKSPIFFILLLKMFLASLEAAGSTFASPGMLLWARTFTDSDYPANMNFYPSTSDMGSARLLTKQVELAGTYFLKHVPFVLTRFSKKNNSNGLPYHHFYAP